MPPSLFFKVTHGLELAFILRMPFRPLVFFVLLSLSSALSHASGDSTEITRRGLLRLFGAAAATTVLPAPLVDALAESAVQSAAKSASVPWGWVENLGMEESIFQCEGDCIYHPADRIRIHGINRKILEGYSQKKGGLTAAQRQTLDTAIQRVDGLMSFESQRLQSLSTNTQNQRHDTTTESSTADEKVLDLVSRYLPVDRLNRLFWQISYPDEDILLPLDYQKLHELFLQMEGLTSALPLKGFLDQKQCHDLVSAH